MLLLRVAVILLLLMLPITNWLALIIIVALGHYDID